MDRAFLPALLVPLALAGCLSISQPLEPAAPPAAAAALPAPLEQAWEGRIVAGAAFEIPAHFQPSEQLVAPVWRTGFVVEIAEAPQMLEVQLDWTAAGPTELMFMVHAPHGAERPEEQGWSEYVSHADTEPWSTTSPMCMRIPAADVASDLEGAKHHGAAAHWYPMAHSRYGVDVDLTFTIRTVGGSVAIPEMFHGHDTNADEVLNIYETSAGPKRPWEPCAA